MTNWSGRKYVCRYSMSASLTRLMVPFIIICPCMLVIMIITRLLSGHIVYLSIIVKKSHVIALLLPSSLKQSHNTK